MQRLTGLITAMAVAVCPILFAVCAERCAHSAESAAASPHQQHSAVSESAGMALSATTGHVHSPEASDSGNQSAACHHAESSPTASAGEPAAALAEATLATAPTQLAAPCAQCSDVGPSLMATRGSTDGSQRATVLAAVSFLLSSRAIAGFNSDMHAYPASSRPTPPPASPSSSTVLRI